MNLLQLRQQFRILSGRYDLVNDDGSDNGADFFINEGCKFLDRLDETQKSWASRFHFLDPGFWVAQFPYCRAIKEVYAATPSARWQLEKLNLQELMTSYMTALPSSICGGTPLYYSPAITRYIPENATAMELEAFAGYVDVLSGNAHEYNSIIVMPPPSERTMLDIRGLFYSMGLVNDTDRNFWSDAHPFLLVMAYMRQLEVINRNTQGVNDWENVIRRDMMSLGMDLTEELISEVTEMEG